MMRVALTLAAALSVVPGIAAAQTRLTVSATAPGAYRSLQAAVDALPKQGGTIEIAPGSYRGQVHIGLAHVRLVGLGRGPEDVVIVAGESSATSGSIYASPTVHVSGDDFRARNLTFENDWERDPAHGSSQAVALAVSGDRAVFDTVRALGGQDTLYLAAAPGRTTRQLFRNCRIEGHVDFIFGNGRTYFDRCEIHGRDHSTVMYTAPARNAPGEKGGFVFDHCRFTAGRAPSGVYFGRPWRTYAQMVLIDSRVETPVAAGGWREWKPGLTSDGRTVNFAEYRTDYRAGPPPQSRMRALSAEEAARYSLENFFEGDIAWTKEGA